MPGQRQWTPSEAVEEARRLEAMGISGVILFGIPSKKDRSGRAAMAKNGVIQKAIRAIKRRSKKIAVIGDVCLCEYLSHGHCGHVKKGRIENDASVKTLARVALSQAEAGADIVAPSDMMDGRVAVIRKILDQNGFKNTPIMSYAVKYASAFYAPFREAAESAPSFGDRRSYQMDPANKREAVREAGADLDEGADILLVKPALAYLDVLAQIRQRYACPTACFSVSGEYAMIKAASHQGWIDEKKIVLETHLSMKRAGADLILTYWAKDIARWTREAKHGR